MFYGEYVHTLDNKDRFVLPSRFREIARLHKIKDFYLTRGLDKCLFLFPEEEWKRLEGIFRNLSFTRQEARTFNRLFFSGAVRICFDSQGRAGIPAYLKEFAQIRTQIVIIGVSNRIEIWSRRIWQQYFNKNKLGFEQIAQNLIT